VAVMERRIGGGPICVGSDDLELPLTQVSRSRYTYKYNISKWVRLRIKVTITHYSTFNIT